MDGRRMLKPNSSSLHSSSEPATYFGAHSATAQLQHGFLELQKVSQNCISEKYYA